MQVVHRSCAEPGRLVACLCVKESFAVMKTHLPDAILLWLDIDLDEDLLPDDLKISTFPILLVAETDGSVIFFGSNKPHFSTMLSLAAMHSINKPKTAGRQNLAALQLADRLVECVKQKSATSLTFSSIPLVT